MVAMLDAAVRPDNSAVAELHAMSNGSNSLTRNGAFDFKQSGARPDCGSLDLRTQWEVHNGARCDCRAARPCCATDAQPGPREALALFALPVDRFE